MINWLFKKVLINTSLKEQKCVFWLYNLIDQIWPNTMFTRLAINDWSMLRSFKQKGLFKQHPVVDLFVYGIFQNLKKKSSKQ